MAKRSLRFKLTKQQLEQLRNSPTLIRRLEEANKVFASPEFREFMKKNPIKKSTRPKIEWDDLVTISVLGADFRDTQLKVKNLKTFIRKSGVKKSFLVSFFDLPHSILKTHGGKLLDEDVSQKLVSLTKLYSVGCRVFPSRLDFNSYLFKTRDKAFKNQIPAKVILSDGNVDRIMKKLKKSDYI